MSAQEKLRYECEYYLHKLRRSFELDKEEAEEEQSGGEENSSQIRIALEKLLVFPRVKELAKGGLSDIRSAGLGWARFSLDFARLPLFPNTMHVFHSRLKCAIDDLYHFK